MAVTTAWEYLVWLSKLPHRGSTTANEARAADMLARELRRWKVPVHMEPFRAPRDTLYRGVAVVSVVVALATLALRPWPWAALAVELAAVLIVVGELCAWRGVHFGLILPHGPSHNVWAELPGSGRDHAGSGREGAGSAANGAQGARRRKAPLILMAHYDTQRASWLFSPPVVRFIPAIFGLVYFALAAAIVATAAGVPATPPAWQPVLGNTAAAVLLVFAALMLWAALRGRHVNGANDNGSGVALALALARRWHERPGGQRPLWLLLTGAEEVGERGAHAFFERHGESLDRSATLVVNLDNLGAGSLRYLTGEGMLRYFPYDEELVSAARVLALHRAPQQVGPWRNLVLPTDALPAAARGFRVVTFVAIGRHGELPHYHWPSDVLAHVDRGLLSFEEDFLWHYLRVIANPPSPSPAETKAAP